MATDIFLNLVETVLSKDRGGKIWGKSVNYFKTK